MSFVNSFGTTVFLMTQSTTQTCYIEIFPRRRREMAICECCVKQLNSCSSYRLSDSEGKYFLYVFCDKISTIWPIGLVVCDMVKYNNSAYKKPGERRAFVQ